MNGIGILPGRHQSYIDHLVPLCHLLNIPLLVTDGWIKQLIEIYYPPLKIILAQPEDYHLDPFVEEYDLFVYVDFFRKGNGTFQFREYTSSKKAHALISLHGNPDKFWHSYWLENLCDEDVILAYGPQLCELIRQKGIKKEPLICGNYRLEFYKEHEQFFDQKVPFLKSKKTLLYAPTWGIVEHLSERRVNLSPFFEIYREVFDALCNHYQLIVKLHPHMIHSMPNAIESIMEEYPHIYFLQDFPPIYPLLKQIDLYLGDYSSIGYDFLYFDRPLFFLETSGQTALQDYGTRVTLKDLPHLHESDCIKRDFYKYVFGPKKDLSSLKQDIENAY